MIKYKCPNSVKWYTIHPNRIIKSVQVYPNNKPAAKVEFTVLCDCGNEHTFSFHAETIHKER